MSIIKLSVNILVENKEFKDLSRAFSEFSIRDLSDIAFPIIFSADGKHNVLLTSREFFKFKYSLFKTLKFISAIKEFAAAISSKETNCSIFSKILSKEFIFLLKEALSKNKN